MLQKTSGGERGLLRGRETEGGVGEGERGREKRERSLVMSRRSFVSLPAASILYWRETRDNPQCTHPCLLRTSIQSVSSPRATMVHGNPCKPCTHTCARAQCQPLWAREGSNCWHESQADGLCIGTRVVCCCDLSLQERLNLR